MSERRRYEWYQRSSSQEVADSAIDSAAAAAIHVHVRDLKSRKSPLEPARCGAVVWRIRESDVNPVINLTMVGGAASCQVRRTLRCTWQQGQEGRT
ncbi:3-keto-5-aminohexanoate cleavage protein [Bradyrhizobium shewense]|uniref:3-keto-5-aminohexanoate cleavage protein n=1 Tax=Bradyrhizobium shewense TaxID=1761772 RepID=UPI000B852614